MRFTTIGCITAAAITASAAAGTSSTLIAGPLEIDIPDYVAHCNSHYVNDQNPDRPGFQALVNVFNVTSPQFTFADGSLKGHIMIISTGAEGNNGKPEVISESRGSRHKFSQFAHRAFTFNDILLVSAIACGADAANTPVNCRLTVFTIHFDEQSGCSEPLLEEVQYVRSGECIADFNEDGGIDGTDMYDFVQAWEHWLPTADIDGDLDVDSDDWQAFFSPWENGGC
ncbi:MAG: hypothetical protein JSR77_06685 [Planctomycetes bacterium]|nr:hypothetical protein [Planctomycetota bacterium]